MIMRIFITTLLLCSHFLLSGQIMVKGTVMNSAENNQPIAFHPVFLVSMEKIIDTVYTNEIGEYRWTSNSQSTSNLYVQTIGFCESWQTYTDTVKFGDSAIQIVDFSICLLNDETSCQAVIDYQTDGQSTVTFENAKVKAVHDMQYFWDFGDGHTSTARSPQHQYAEEGVYTVSLIIKTPLQCTDTTTKEVLASENSFVRGEVSIPGNYLSEAEIWLIGVDTNENNIIQTITPNDNGNYNFFCSPNSIYLLKVVPNFPMPIFPRILPTYLGYTTSWTEATPLNVAHEIKDLDLNTLTSNVMLHGKNTIKGTFLYNSPLDQLPLNVILLDKNKNPLDHALVTNEEFEFTGLPRGLYFVQPECPGKTSLPTPVNFQDDFDDIAHTNFYITKTQIRPTSISDAPGISEVNIYPIPFNNELNIRTNSPIESIQLLNTNGQLIKSIHNPGSDYSTINTAGIPKGSYIIKISHLEKEPVFKLITK
jgi:PKD repeat protein